MNFQFQQNNSTKQKQQIFVHVDHDFLKLYKIDIIAGREFQRDITTDKNHAFIINHAAVKDFGWRSPKDALGKHLSCWGMEGQIIGVSHDFHFNSLQHAIEPLVIGIHPFLMPEFLTLKLSSNNLSETMVFIENKWNEIFPDNPFIYKFLDDDFSRLYYEDQKISKLVTIFTILAVFIACLGLFGLASFTIEQRTKEIGIRKVMGGSSFKIANMFLKQYVKWICLANILAWPIAYYALNKWLQNYAYRIDINWGIFFMAGIITLLIALLTVSFQTFKAATTNPVEALKYE